MINLRKEFGVRYSYIDQFTENNATSIVTAIAYSLLSWAHTYIYALPICFGVGWGSNLWRHGQHLQVPSYDSTSHPAMHYGACGNTGRHLWYYCITPSDRQISPTNIHSPSYLSLNTPFSHGEYTRLYHQSHGRCPSHSTRRTRLLYIPRRA